MTQDQEIQEVIKKNLPSHVGDLLKQRLEQADKDAAQLKVLSEQVDKLIKAKLLQNDKLSEYAKLDDRNSKLESRDVDVTEKERNLKIKELEFQLISEKEKTQFAKDVALGLVRNTEYKRSLYDSISEPYKDQYGNTMYQNKTQNSEETTTAK